MNTFRSDISGKSFPVSEKVSGKTIRHSVLSLIQKDHPEFTHSSHMSMEELNFYREKYMSEFLSKQIGELSDLDNKVLSSMKNNETITDKLDGEEEVAATFGARVADKVASFGGSWKFIIMFGLFILIWIIANVVLLVNRGFDPYPFILLNLILSCIASIQAPVIMMSQNRQEEKDRERAKKDYMINLKAELEIRNMREEIDHFIMGQQQELIELQEVQIEIMNNILKNVEKKAVKESK